MSSSPPVPKIRAFVPKMPSICEADKSISGILTLLKFIPLLVLPIFLFAIYLLVLKSSKHMQPSKRAYGFFLSSKFLCLVFLSSGIAPIIHTPSYGFLTTGFLKVFYSFNPMWPVVLTVIVHLVMLCFLVQVINTRCETIQKFSANEFAKEQKMFDLIRILLKVFYFFILFSIFCVLLTTGFGTFEDQQRLRKSAEKRKVKNIECPIFFFLDIESWRFFISIVSIAFLLITFLIYSSAYISGVYHILKESRMKISNKVWKIQSGFLFLLGLQVILLFFFLLFLPVVFIGIRAPGSEPTLLAILLFISQHGTVSTLVFIIAHRSVRSRIFRLWNKISPKPYRVGVDLNVDHLGNHSIPRQQVFAVITETTTV